MNAENKNLTVQIQNTTTPNRKRIVIEYPCEVEQYDITVAQGRLTDVLKVFEAMYEQGMFIHRDGARLKKGDFMTIVGAMLNVSTKNWGQILETGYRGNSALKVFQRMMELGRSRWV